VRRRVAELIDHEVVLPPVMTPDEIVRRLNAHLTRADCVVRRGPRGRHAATIDEHINGPAARGEDPRHVDGAAGDAGGLRRPRGKPGETHGSQSIVRHDAREASRFHWMPATSSRYRYRLVMQTWFFWGLAAVSVVASLLVVGQRNAVRGTLALTGLLVAVGGLYLLLSATLVAVLQITLNAAVVLAFVLPVTLFLDLPEENDDGVDVGASGGPRRAGVMLAAILVVELAWAFQRVRGATLPVADRLPDDGPVTTALRVVSDYAPGFALATMLVAAAALGVLLLVRREAR
jgi:NADH:ubiquinone oxidoreductase subunit 6 (subunit J)